MRNRDVPSSMLIASASLNRLLTCVPVSFTRAVVNDTRDIDRAILRIITTTGTTSRTTGATIGFSLHHYRRPEELYIAVRATPRSLRREDSLCTLSFVSLLALHVQFLLTFSHTTCGRVRPCLSPAISITYRLLEPHRRNIRDLLEMENGEQRKTSKFDMVQ